MVEMKLGACWLITWVGTDRDDEDYVTVLSARLGERDVAAFVELFHVATAYEPEDQIAQAKYNNPHNPYRAEKHRGKIVCGHNPHLFARKVNNFRFERGDDGEGRTSWDEVPLPRRSKLLPQ